MIPYILTDESLSIFHDGKSLIISRFNTNFPKCLDLLRDRDFDQLAILIEDANKPLEAYSSHVFENVEVDEDGNLLVKGEMVKNGVARRIKEFYSLDLDYTPLVKFVQNIMENPSYNSRDQLYNFLEHENIPITDDGCFIAYKSVDSNFYSKKAGNLTILQGKTKDGKIYNGVGEVIECNRSEIDDNPNNHCSQGLHVGSLNYSGPNGYYNSEGNKIVLVKVNPKDVVSVPNDHSCAKVRTCKYEVIDEFKTPLSEPYYEEYDDSWCDYCGGDDEYCDGYCDCE